MKLQTMPLRFRVWDTSEKEFIKAEKVGAQNWDCKFNHDTEYFEMESDERFIISQDTGLKDKNGKSICTGDIVYNEHFNRYTSVEYMYGMVVERFGEDDSYLAQFIEEIEVIGNIWQNSDLLEKR